MKATDARVLHPDPDRFLTFLVAENYELNRRMLA
jgi:hypothetical protein